MTIEEKIDLVVSRAYWHGYLVGFIGAFIGTNLGWLLINLWLR